MRTRVVSWGRWGAEACAACGATAILLDATQARADFAIGPDVYVGMSLMALFWIFVGSFVVALLARGLLILFRRKDRPGEKTTNPLRVAFRVTILAAVPIGLLALLGVWSALNPPPRPKRPANEARSNLGAIRSTEVAFFAEWNVYVGNQPFNPAGSPAGKRKKQKWDSGTRFSILGFAPEGDVWCRYAIEGPDYPTQAEGFTARAECDLEGKGELTTYWITASETEVRTLRPGEPWPPQSPVPRPAAPVARGR